MIPETLEWHGKFLRIIDQRELPDKVLFIDCYTVREVVDAIRTLAVRGAPAIGIAAAYGVVLGALRDRNSVESAIAELAASRPTAVNLFWALERMRNEALKSMNESDVDFIHNLTSEASGIHFDDIEGNRRIGMFGSELLPERVTVLTHCNAGALATGGYGTALGVIRAAREAGKSIKVYACETRPLLQGARLTVWELEQDGFDVTLICDSMAAALMRSHYVDAVITGADRIAANGDTANKIGTYSLAVLASHHKIPFYIAAPGSTLDVSTPTGAEIPIEERAPEEIKILPGSGRSVPDSIKTWNPAFDVTPSELITAIILDNGVYRYPYAFKIPSIL